MLMAFGSQIKLGKYRTIHSSRYISTKMTLRLQLLTKTAWRLTVTCLLPQFTLDTSFYSRPRRQSPDRSYASLTSQLTIFHTYVSTFKPRLHRILKRQIHQQLNTLCNIIVAHMPLLMATSAFGLRRIHQSSTQYITSARAITVSLLSLLSSWWQRERMKGDWRVPSRRLTACHQPSAETDWVKHDRRRGELCRRQTASLDLHTTHTPHTHTHTHTHAHYRPAAVNSSIMFIYYWQDVCSAYAGNNSLLRGNFKVFRSARGTHCTNRDEIWHGGVDSVQGRGRGTPET